jgi:hypothetical protein
MENQEKSLENSSVPPLSTQPWPNLEGPAAEQFMKLTAQMAADIHRASAAIQYACRAQVEMLQAAQAAARAAQGAPAQVSDVPPWDQPY